MFGDVITDAHGRPRHNGDASGSGEFVVIPALRAMPGHSGRFILTQKFIDGMGQFARRWPGPVTAVMRMADQSDGSLDHVETDPKDVPFGLEPIPHDSGAVERRLANAQVVLAALVPDFADLAARCCRGSVPLVYIAETDLRTRRQMIDAETRHPLRRLRRKVRTTLVEQKFRKAVSLSAGVQCNGLPTYAAYHALNPHSIFFFDTRVGEAMLIDPERLERRIHRLLQPGPLRLAFSGRLTAIKGADHLPIMAAELRRLGVTFDMQICGDGDLSAAIERDIQRLGLTDCVTMRGVLDFHRQLVPMLQDDVDLFACCHPQGDPSCTYLETMSCGVPIAGYDNDAFVGLAEQSAVGWTVSMNRPREMAQVIARMNQDRPALADAARRARAFAAGHTSEKTFKRRVDHMMAAGSSPRKHVAAEASISIDASG